MNRNSAIGLAIVAALLITGCAKPPQVSPGNRRLVDGLRTATSSKQATWLEDCAKRLEDGRQKGTVSDVEYQEFLAIIALARDGKWEQAEAETTRLGKAQKPTPEDVARLQAAEGRTPGK
ncbi:MAG TPA: hypothetical protein VMV69_25460 [Pirellulales bacterium]|nr:hypothetical protein [Pirellulales bacterium]